MTTRNKRKLAALNKENCEEHPRSNLTQSSNAPRSQEDYITQVSEEIEGRVTRRLSKEFSRTENRILGDLARLDEFLMNPLLQGHSGGLSEPIEYKPGNEWGRLPEWSSSWSRPLPQPDYAKLWPSRGPWHGDRSSERERERVFAAITWWQEFREREHVSPRHDRSRKSHTAPLVHRQENRKRTVLRVNRNSAARTPLWRSRQTKVCWPFSSWQITTFLRTSKITSTEFPNCQNH